jgi:hypothetical protein
LLFTHLRKLCKRNILPLAKTSVYTIFLDETLLLFCPHPQRRLAPR